MLDLDFNGEIDVRGHFYQVPDICPRNIRFREYLTCHECGEDVEFKQENGVARATTNCIYTNGMQSYSVDIDVHSGKLVFCNDLREFFPVADEFYVNIQSEIRRCTETYAANGCIHMYVGNTCPEIREVNGKEGFEIIVGVSDYEEEERSPDNPNASLPGEYRGWICTDLWWVSAADLADVEARGKILGLSLPNDLTILDVEPGRYRTTTFRHTYDEMTYPAVFASIKRIGEVEGEDFISFPKVDRPFETEILVSRLAFPTLYPIRAYVLDRFFCVGGTGTEWYDGILINSGIQYLKARTRLAAGEEVTWSDDPDSQTKRYFYPLNENSRLANIPDDIKPDWLRGAYEIIDLILATDPNYIGPGDWPNSHNIEFAKNIKKDLNKRFIKKT